MGDKRSGLLAAVFDELARALVDVRRQVVERGWFGQVDPPRASDFYGQTEGVLAPSRNNVTETRAPSFEEQWAPRDTREPTHAEEQDLGIDR